MDGIAIYHIYWYHSDIYIYGNMFPFLSPCHESIKRPVARACFVGMALAQPLMWHENGEKCRLAFHDQTCLPQLLSSVRKWWKIGMIHDDSNWEWLQRFWNWQLEWVRLVTTGYPKWICVETGENFTAPQIYGHKLMEACWQTNRFSDKPKSAGWPMYSKNAKSTFLRKLFFWGERPGKLCKQLPEHAMNYVHLQGFKASLQLPATVKYVYPSKSSIYNII